MSKHETRGYGLNRIAAPDLSLQEFCSLARHVGAVGVEFRNDLPRWDVIDGMEAAAVNDLLHEMDLTVLAINAVQHFNYPGEFSSALDELQRLIAVGSDIGRPPIVLCPHNDVRDDRSESAMVKDTIEALRKLSPVLEDAGVLGLIEPLGFPESSLRSPGAALEVVDAVSSPSLRILIDTFHAAVAGELQDISAIQSFPIEQIGLIHVSGVESTGAVEKFRDPDRGLLNTSDRLGSASLVNRLFRAGYEGCYSWEPFAPSVQELPVKKLITAVLESVHEVSGGLGDGYGWDI